MKLLYTKNIACIRDRGNHYLNLPIDMTDTVTYINYTSNQERDNVYIHTELRILRDTD